MNDGLQCRISIIMWLGTYGRYGVLVRISCICVCVCVCVCVYGQPFCLVQSTVHGGDEVRVESVLAPAHLYHHTTLHTAHSKLFSHLCLIPCLYVNV